MNYDIKAYPTRYNGTQFRSRLEAKWAAFFDLCGWRWEYEPFDFEGWVPDFLIKGSDKNLLVEVKPYSWTNDDTHSCNLVCESDVLGKLFRANREEVLLLGAYPLGGERWLGSRLGIFVNSPDCEELMGSEYVVAKPNSGGISGYIDFTVLNFGQSHKYDVSADHGFYTLRLGGEYAGDHFLNPVGGDEVTKLWREASNRVQKQFK
jgi:hypothetical protein